MTAKGKISENMVENKTKGRELQAYCPDCRRDREHVVVVSVDTYFSEDFNEYSGISAEDNYQVIKCRCGCLSFRHLNWFSEFQDQEASGYTEILYPPRKPDSLPVKKFQNVPTLISKIYEETIKTFNDGSYTLCAAGLRVIVEGICEVNGVKDGPVTRQQKDGSDKDCRSNRLEGKIYGLCEKDILTKKSADMLHEHRFLGNGAVHDLAEPGERELRIAIELIEHILEDIFVMPQKAETLKKIRLRAKIKSVDPA
ncbi:DUF4145 domain-containing protein [Oryzomonas sagensis]|uniref:DUF4145 domain-containing protein n=1 Tax=Oryzomonas sagensis TaxID=2603857 RepID=A0ABQ6TPU6_9BACT|nr:DUF4145 domain-containing protein [Oryzomonas sagensis]KAB0671066.1 DUF4145 domain-containing protein [Oryzomonas sagensis]